MIPIRRDDEDDDRRGRGAPAPRVLSDDQILELLRDRDLRALEILMHRFGDRITDFLARLLGDVHAAEDLVHDTFVRALETAGECRDAASVRVWLLRIARNLALDRMRSRAVRRRVHDELRRCGRASLRTTERDLADRELLARIEAAVAELPEPFRSVFLLREIEGLTYEEIGAVVGVPPKTVSTRLARGRAFLRARLVGYLGDGS